MNKSISIALVCLLWITIGSGQNKQDSDSLALKLQNPIAQLVIFPVNIDYDYGFDPNDGTRTTIKLEPVIPASLGEKWRMIVRVVAPFVAQSDIFIPNESETGLQDFTISTFFIPKKKGLSYGFGPVISLPTATNELLGTEKLSIGPTAVLINQANKTTFGVLVNQSWSIVGDSDRANVSAAALQPFFAQNFSRGWSILSAAEISHDWKNDLTNGRWFILGQKLVNFGRLPVQCAIGPGVPFGNGNSAEFGFRFRMTASL